MSKVGKWESGKPHLKKKFDFQQKKSLKNLVNSPKIRTFVPLLEKTSGNKICGITIEKIFLSALVSFS